MPFLKYPNIFSVLLIFFLAGCSTNLMKQTETGVSERTFAGSGSKIIIFNPGAKSALKKQEEFDGEKWARLQPGGRHGFLSQMYYANSDEGRKSNRGNDVDACFVGYAKDVEAFLVDDSNPVDYLSEKYNSKPIVRVSSDGRMIGVGFETKNHKTAGENGKRFFRLSNCGDGKNPIGESNKKLISMADEKGNIVDFEKVVNFHQDSNRNPAQKIDWTPAELKSGFAITDSVLNGIAPSGRKFKLKGNFNEATSGDETVPWSGMDVSNSTSALKFALVVQKYIYEGMIDKSAPDDNFDAFNDTKGAARFWCHMPWMHSGAAGREAVHGLTKERNLFKSTMYPDVINNAASNWGVGYFNKFGCKTLNKIFGSESNPKEPTILTPSKLLFEDKTLITKILFTTADQSKIGSSTDLSKAFTWKANVVPGSSGQRKIMDVKHIQMDVAIRDTSLKGIIPGNNHWLMLAYYYDPTYNYKQTARDAGDETLTSYLDSIPAGSNGFKYIRPAGIQLGFAVNETIVFKGGKTNGNGGRLNGPADNPQSSCLSCHGVAGTGRRMSPGRIDGTLASESTHLDFNQQLALAKANIETYIKNL